MTSALNDSVDFTTAIGSGGRGEVEAEITDAQGRKKRATATLFVDGKNPPIAGVDAKLREIGAQSYSGPTKNILTGIAAKESSYASPGTVAGQFSQNRLRNCKEGVAEPLNPVRQGSIQGWWPTEDCASGTHVGLLQVAASSAAVAWDWLANINAAVTILQFHYNKAVTNEVNLKNLCNGRPNKPGAMSAVQLEVLPVTGLAIASVPTYGCLRQTVRRGFNKPTLHIDMFTGSLIRTERAFLA